ncbi:thiol:disulfide oxidoreductase [Allostella vacuolata]|nr:thiol:disulfide oxidoreductase [Stella vacuolata]
MLEEVGLPYRVHPVNIGKNEQFAPDFLKISPNNRIPAIVDPDGPGGKSISLFESGAILIYLADKTGKFYPAEPTAHYMTLQWVMWQMGGFGPMLGQAHHFRRAAPEPVPYAIDRYTNEAKRLYGVIDKRLGEAEYLGGDEYTIADIITYPWAARHEWHAVDLDQFPNVRRWYDTVGARPAVQRGMAVPG